MPLYSGDESDVICWKAVNRSLRRKVRVVSVGLRVSVDGRDVDVEPFRLTTRSLQQLPRTLEEGDECLVGSSLKLICFRMREHDVTQTCRVHPYVRDSVGGRYRGEPFEIDPSTTWCSLPRPACSK
jgi:hypothetical protein